MRIWARCGMADGARDGGGQAVEGEWVVMFDQAAVDAVWDVG